MIEGMTRISFNDVNEDKTRTGARYIQGSNAQVLVLMHDMLLLASAELCLVIIAQAPRISLHC